MGSPFEPKTLKDHVHHIVKSVKRMFRKDYGSPFDKQGWW